MLYSHQICFSFPSQHFSFPVFECDNALIVRVFLLLLGGFFLDAFDLRVKYHLDKAGLTSASFEVIVFGGRTVIVVLFVFPETTKWRE